MRSPEEYRTAIDLLTQGLSSTEVARRLGLPRSTVENWRRRPAPGSRSSRASAEPWRPDDPERYCYLLGLYLGDGCIVRARHSGFLRLYLDNLYEGLIAEARAAMETAFPASTVRRYDYGREERAILHVAGHAVIAAFPQHGPGKKHERPIVLEPWQRELTTQHPGALVRGLIHSDGCRSINRFTTKLPSGRVARYEYPRYFFSNLSADIRAIFCEHCELLGIRWTQSNPRNISVSHRHSVAILERLVGPKT